MIPHDKHDDRAGLRGWRSLDELAGTPEFLDRLAREFPSQADQWRDADSRRQFLRLMGASLALAGVSGCAFQPMEEIVPYVRQPEEILPGRPLSYASVVTLDGYATGVLVTSQMGRPVKIEGNERHPASLGGTDVFAQAAVLGLYDPDRSQTVLLNGRVSTWGDFLGKLTTQLDADHLGRGQGRGLRILTGTVTSPTLGRLLNKVLERFPKARWHQDQPVSRHRVLEGTKLAFGTELEPVYHFDKAEVVVAFDADFLGRGPGRVRAARDFASRRETTVMNRLYVAESTPSITGSMADHRLPEPSRLMASHVAVLAREVGVEGALVPAVERSPEAKRWLDAAVRELKAHKQKGLVIVGEDQPAEVHALVQLINATLENHAAVEYIAPVAVRPAKPEQGGTLEDLVRDMDAGAVEVLILLDCNPVYSAPADLDFAAHLDKVKFSAHLGLYENETTDHCRWHVPMAHTLEAWGDARAFDGTASIQQPLIAPLFGGQSPIELVAAMTGEAPPAGALAHSGLRLVRETWEMHHEGEGFEAFWRKSVHDGVIAGTTAQAQKVTARPASSIPAPAVPPDDALELVFRPDPTTWDGQFANNGWLQELPKPLTKLTWDNAVHISPATAQNLGIQSEDLIVLDYQGRSLEAAVWVLAGHADNSVTIHLGYGRRHAGQVGTGAGFNAYAIRTSKEPAFGTGLAMRPTGRTYRLANTQVQQAIDTRLADRDMVRVVPVHQLDELKKHPAEDRREQAMTLVETPEPERRREEGGVGNAWAMAINLNTCIGCGACEIACQAENNIPVVGKKQVIAGRTMHWIRVDHYYKGAPANPKMYHQPVPCMHCEKAPCELVCPVGATTHSAEGLNEMTYNRCVGTRYCGNNCPYKVRRFNFFQYSDLVTASLKLQRNPEVTVRTRGVMEKCTYCVQRLNHARMEAEKSRGDEQVRDGDGLQTACQQACPTRAIIFGNKNDRTSAVAQARSDARHYELLAELNTRPRTTYLAKLTNPNTELEAE